jgi:malonate transporter and related proteins
VLAVLDAFAVITVVIALGALVGRTGVLGDEARMVLNRVAFHIGVPALLVLNLSKSTLQDIFSAALLTSAIAALVTFSACFGILTLIRRRAVDDSTVGAWAASYVNAGNLGIALSTYLFAGTSEIAAVFLFQTLIMVPMGLTIINSIAGQRVSPWRQFRALLINPVVLASLAGLSLAAFEFRLPDVVSDPIHLLADLAIPTALLSFGISLSSDSRSDHYSRVDLAIVLLFKMIVMPVVAYAVGRWGVGITSEELVVVTTMAALPCAQNVNTYAAVCRRNESLAGHVTVASTVFSMPVIATLVAVLGG